MSCPPLATSRCRCRINEIGYGNGSILSQKLAAERAFCHALWAANWHVRPGARTDHEIELRRERGVSSLEDGRHAPKDSSTISIASDRATAIAGFRWYRRRGTVRLCHREEWH